MKLSKDFLLAGKAIFTVELSPESAREHRRPHYVFMVRRQRGLGNRYAVLLLNRGADFPLDNRYVGEMDGKGMTFAARSYADPRACEQFRDALAVILAGGGVALDRFKATGRNLLPSLRCCRCSRELVAPASVETGVGPECELYVKLGIGKLDEVPCMADRLVARLQLDYWMNSDKATLAVLHDACLDAFGDDQVRATLLVEATRKTMRKFKKGKSLSWNFLRFAEGQRGE